MSSYIKKFNEISIADIGIVGGKNSSLGEMFNKLSSKVIEYIRSAEHLISKKEMVY